MNPNSSQFEINAPNAYRPQKPSLPKTSDAEIKPVPNSMNKVHKRVVRGVLIHDISPNKHE